MLHAYLLTEMPSPTDSFGARLRRHREQQRVELATIANQTKIKLSLLEGLERDDVSHWPSGIFRRAYVRAYAQAIALNPDEVVREFLEVHPDPADVVEPAAPMAPTTVAPSGPRGRLRTIVASAFESLARTRRAPVNEEIFVGGGAADLPVASADDLPEPAVRRVAPEPVQMARPPAPPPSSPPSPTAPLAAPRVEPAPVPAPAPAREPDLMAVAHACMRMARVSDAAGVQRALEEAAKVLDAKGTIVWIWDPSVRRLRPALGCGYSDRVLAQLPDLSADADNPTSAAFKTAQVRSIGGIGDGNAALAVPLLTPGGCAGVLAMEVPPGTERTTFARAVATIFGAALAQLVGGPAEAELPTDTDVVLNAT